MQLLRHSPPREPSPIGVSGERLAHEMTDAAEQMQIGDMVCPAFDASKDMGALKAGFFGQSAGEADAAKVMHIVITKLPGTDEARSPVTKDRLLARHFPIHKPIEICKCCGCKEAT